MEEYIGWIFVEEKLPQKNEEVLVAYVDDGEVEYMITRYGETRVINSVYKKWYLPQYYKQDCVKAWRKIPPFAVEQFCGKE